LDYQKVSELKKFEEDVSKQEEDKVDGGDGKKFKDAFKDIKEDNFDSSEDEADKKRNERLERMGQVADNIKNNGAVD
jgi:hypothetical protein